MASRHGISKDWKKRMKNFQSLEIPGHEDDDEDGLQ